MKLGLAWNRIGIVVKGIMDEDDHFKEVPSILALVK
jgi:hypothetical protein